VDAFRIALTEEP